MPSESKVYIAGVGYSPLPSGSSSAKEAIAVQVSAATKALLDAGVTYDDVTHGVGSGKSKKTESSTEAFKVFDDGGITVDEVESGSEFDSSVRLVRDKGAECVLMVAVEKSAVIAFVLVSDTLLWSRSYLKDSAVMVRQSDGKSSGSGKGGLHSICQMVWALRGWSKSQGKDKSLQYKGNSGQSYELSRADGGKAPEWKEVEYKQDGKYRLRYNPATDTKEIFQEDFEAVRPSGEKPKEDKRIKFKRAGGDRAALAKL